MCANEVSIPNEASKGVGLIDAIAVWCSVVHGRKVLRDGLQSLLVALDAEAIALTRLRQENSHLGNSVIVDSHKRGTSDLTLSRSYAAIVLGKYLFQCRPGVPWYSSMVEDTADPALREFQNRTGLREMIVIPLELRDKTIDVLEIHFRQRIDSDRLALLNLLQGTLVRTWAERATGLFTDAILSARSQRSTRKAFPLLSLKNPAKLSAKEYKVCLHLSHGLSPKSVETEMAICAATVRSHLRKIYAKTDSDSLAELLFKLLDNRELRILRSAKSTSGTYVA